MPLSVHHRDPQYACFCVQQIVSRGLFSGRDTATGALMHLEPEAKFLLDLALDPGEKLGLLSAEAEQTLEKNWGTILLLLKQGSLSEALTSEPLHKTELMVCLANVGAFIALKTRRRHRDPEFAVHLFAFTLATVRACLETSLLPQSALLLDLAENHIQRRLTSDDAYDFDRLCIDDGLSCLFRSCRNFAFVLRVLTHFQNGKYDDILPVLMSTRNDPVELDEQQSASLFAVCLNVGLALFGKNQFENAIQWLQFAFLYSSGPQKQSKVFGAVPLNENSEQVLSMLATCYLRLGTPENLDLAIQTLDFADNSVVNLELRLHVMIASGKESRTIASCASKYLRAKSVCDSDGSATKSAVHRLFAFLEETQKHQLLMELLDRIPWYTSWAEEVQSVEQDCWPSVDLIRASCAAFATRCYIRHNRTEDLFALLCEISQWTNLAGEDEFVVEIVASAENVALSFLVEKNDAEAAFRWYDLLVTFANREGIESTLIWNAIACSLRLPNPIGFNKAKQMFRLVSNDADSSSDPIHSCIRLQLALMSGDYAQATETIANLDTLASTLDCSSLAKAISSSTYYVTENGMLDSLAPCLRAALERCQSPSLKFVLLQFVLRVEIENLRDTNVLHGESNRENVLKGILETIQSAASLTQDIQMDPYCAEQRTWFAKMAWNLGRSAKPYANLRHHLFKLSSKLFPSEPRWQEKTEMAMLYAMKAALDFGRHSAKNTVPYVRVLKSSLDVADEFYRTMPESRRTHLVNLMEFHALCEMKNWAKVEQLFSTYLVDRKQGRSADFFQNVAAIAIGAKDARLCEVVDDQIGGGTVTFRKWKIPAQQRLCLSAMAAKSLKVAIDLSTPASRGGTFALSPKIPLYCRWIVDVLFDEPEMLVEPHQQRNLWCLINELRPWLRSPDYPFVETRWLFTKIVNASLLFTDQKYKRQILRWVLEECQKSIHSKSLMELFKYQIDHVMPAP